MGKGGAAIECTACRAPRRVRRHMPYTALPPGICTGLDGYRGCIYEQVYIPLLLGPPKVEM